LKSVAGEDEREIILSRGGTRKRKGENDEVEMKLHVCFILIWD
jgi:hypothetical protein